MSIVNTKSTKDRIREIVHEHGGPSLLARAAGLSPSTISQYLSDEKGRASEPGVNALIKLARAAKVRIEWLATGAPPKHYDEPPPGYVSIGSYDLTVTGSDIRAILPYFEHPPRTRLFLQSDLVGVADVSLVSFALEGANDLGFEPEVHPGDILIVSVPHGHDVVRPSMVETWDFIDEAGIYLVADGRPLKLRKLRRHKESLQVVDDQGRIERTLTGAPRDFILFGRVIWRGGVIAHL